MEQNLMMPGNPRYQPKDLIDYFGYDNLFRGVAVYELITLEVLNEIGVITDADLALLTPEIREKIFAIPTSQVDVVEREITKHDIRAWIRLAQELLPPELARWLHIPHTSYDPLDTSRNIQFLRANRNVIRPKMVKVLAKLAGLVKKFAETLQIGRTHGQHALPITVGFWLACILYRLAFNLRQMDRFSGELVGKVSGAVGAHNAQYGLNFAARCGTVSFEDRLLRKLGLPVAPISSQILLPDPLAYFLFSHMMASSNFGQLGRDCRQLMRTEIAEVQEEFVAGQVGSSTMANKRNPINFENLEGTWIKTKNEFGKVVDTLISEHQRDLVGSCVARDFPIILINLTQQLDTLLRKGKDGRSFLERISINETACRRNFDMSSGLILAEPIYISLQIAGYTKDAHKLVNEEAMPIAVSERIPLITAVERLAEQHADVQDALEHIPEGVLELFHTPERYTGDAAERASAIADDVLQFLADTAA